MRLRILLFGLICFRLLAPGGPASASHAAESDARGAAELRKMIQVAPRLQREQTDVAVRLPKGEKLGMVSWIARDSRRGVTWLIQRGDQADPVIAVDSAGNILHSFGKGMFKIPHAIRLDSEGNVWTVDAGSSVVIKFNRAGQPLLRIDVSGRPLAGSDFGGATDVGFASNGRILISDGYANSRILEYTAEGKKIREWGSAGKRAGQFFLPHSVVVDENDIVYVADRENGRIEKFDLEGNFRGEIPNLGRIYSLKLGGNGSLWASMQPHNEPAGSPGWLVKLDRKSGKILGYVPVTERAALHCVEDAGDDQPMTDVGNSVVVFRRR